MIDIGTVLHGFCGGAFGRDSYGDKRIEGYGRDWVVAREIESGIAQFAECNPEDLVQYTAGYGEE